MAIYLRGDRLMAEGKALKVLAMRPSLAISSPGAEPRTRPGCAKSRGLNDRPVCGLDRHYLHARAWLAAASCA
jgi:hypothetical protein